MLLPLIYLPVALSLHLEKKKVLVLDRLPVREDQSSQWIYRQFLVEFLQ